MKKVFVVDGADSSGKTTLAREIVRQSGGSILHGQVFEDMFHAHEDMFDAALLLARHQVVVVDRHWVSEQLYGPVMRSKAAYSTDVFDKAWRRVGACQVLCSPRDRAAHLARFYAERLRGEYVQDARIEAIVDAYAALRDGDSAWPRDETHTDWLTRSGGMAERLDVAVYDVDTDGRQLTEFVRLLLEE